MPSLKQWHSRQGLQAEHRAAVRPRVSQGAVEVTDRLPNMCETPLPCWVLFTEMPCLQTTGTIIIPSGSTHPIPESEVGISCATAAVLFVRVPVQAPLLTCARGEANAVENVFPC